MEVAVVMDELTLIVSLMVAGSDPSTRAQAAAAPMVPQVPWGCMALRNWEAAPMREPTSYPTTRAERKRSASNPCISLNANAGAANKNIGVLKANSDLASSGTVLLKGVLQGLGAE